MTKTGQYTKHVRLYVTEEMYQLLQFLSERQRASVNDVIRQAIREHVDAQEDVMGSRSRLGRTFLGRLEAMHRELLEQVIAVSKLLLAATIVMVSEQGLDATDVVRRITTIARQPGLDKILRTGK